MQEQKDNNQWYYLPPHVQTTIRRMLEFGFMYEGEQDYWGWGDFVREGWDIQIDEGSCFEENPIAHLNATWIENGRFFCYRVINARSHNSLPCLD